MIAHFDKCKVAPGPGSYFTINIHISIHIIVTSHQLRKKCSLFIITIIIQSQQKIFDSPMYLHKYLCTYLMFRNMYLQ